MRFNRVLAIATCAAPLVFFTGCADHTADYAQQQPAPPGYSNAQPNYDPGPRPYGNMSPAIEVGDRRGFELGRADGQHDAYSGTRWRARSTRAYFDTPGYQADLGSFGEYQNAFRLAYLRGYNSSYNGNGR